MGFSTLVAIALTVSTVGPDVPVQRPAVGRDNSVVATEAEPSPPEAVTTDAPSVDAPVTTEIETSTAAPEAAPVETAQPASESPAVTSSLPTDAELAQLYAASTDDLDRIDRDLRRAQALISIGAVATTAGLLMLIGAATEAAKPPCKFDLDTCANAPRPRMARGLGIGAAVTLVGGATLIGIGGHRRHRLRARIDADAKNVALTVSGRF